MASHQREREIVFLKGTSPVRLEPYTYNLIWPLSPPRRSYHQIQSYWSLEFPHIHFRNTQTFSLYQNLWLIPFEYAYVGLHAGTAQKNEKQFPWCFFKILIILINFYSVTIVCPSANEWIKKLWYIYTMEFYTAERKKELIPFATAWMELESIMLSEISQAVRDKYHMISPLTGT